MEGQVTILPAEPADFPGLWQLQRLAYATESQLYDEPIPPMTQSLEQAIADCERNFVWKACSGDKIVGSVRARLQPDGSCLISKLMVLPAYRRRGIGSTLLRAAELAFPGTRCELFTGTRSLGNIRLYEANGYRITRTDAQQELVYLAKPAAAGSIRLAVDTDYPEVIALYQAAIAEMLRQGILQWDEIYPAADVLLADILARQMHVMVIAGQVAAAVVLNDEQSPEYDAVAWQYRCGRVAVVHRLCVHPAWQGRGIAKQMMVYAESFLAGAGYQSIRLDAYPPNRRAIRLYESLDYRYAGQVTFRKGQFHVYEKLLKAREASP